MEVEKIKLDKDQAAELYKKYKRDLHYSSPMDNEIRNAYYQISKGKTIIRARESIIKAGCDAEGLPKLAIIRADFKSVFLTIAHYRNLMRMVPSERRFNSKYNNTKTSSMFFDFNTEDFPDLVRQEKGVRNDYEAIAPIIPRDIRPKRALENYHILWEAVWKPQPPVDPYLLRRIGRSDMWIVLGAWDLTEVEQAVLASRIGVH